MNVSRWERESDKEKIYTPGQNGEEEGEGEEGSLNANADRPATRRETGDRERREAEDSGYS